MSRPKKAKHSSSPPVAAAPIIIHPVLKPIVVSDTASLALDKSLTLLGLPVAQTGQLDRIVPLDNFAAGKVAPKRRTRPVCPQAARVLDAACNLAAVAAKLHSLWLQYMQQLTENTTKRVAVEEVELLGAMVEVEASLNEANVGIRGIVVKAGVNALSVFSKNKNKVLLLPRDVCRFKVSLEPGLAWIVDTRLIR